MTRVDLPEPRGGVWLGVILERHEIAGTIMASVTIRGRAGGRPERHWLSDEAAALAVALTRADAKGLPFFDLRDGGPAL